MCDRLFLEMPPDNLGMLEHPGKFGPGGVPFDDILY